MRADTIGDLRQWLNAWAAASAGYCKPRGLEVRDYPAAEWTPQVQFVEDCIVTLGASIWDGKRRVQVIRLRYLSVLPERDKAERAHLSVQGFRDYADETERYLLDIVRANSVKTKLFVLTKA